MTPFLTTSITPHGGYHAIYISRHTRVRHEHGEGSARDNHVSDWPDKNWLDWFAENPLEGAYAEGCEDEKQGDVFTTHLLF